MKRCCGTLRFNYSVFHSANAQSRAALAAALLLPLANLDNRKILLHVPRGFCTRSAEKTTPKASPFKEHDRLQFDRLLTLSANARGMKAVLGSVFYEPDIPSNACGAWLQGTMAVLQSKGAANLQVLARMLFDRGPHVSYLWIGGITTSVHRDFLRSTSSLLGLNRIELHEAAWTGTTLSSIQEPVSQSHYGSKSISRADECRLMFLTQEPPREHPPMYPYPPLGDTDIRDADLGVQLHAYRTPISNILRDDEDVVVEVDFAWLDRERDFSEGVTSNLFTWMRDRDRFTLAERIFTGINGLRGLIRTTRAFFRREMGALRQV